MTLGGEFTGGESSWWRGDRKPTEKKRLIRDLSGLGQIVICNTDKPFAIQYMRKTSQVFVKCHYTTTNEFGLTFES